MPLFGNRPGTDATTWEPQAADGRLAQTAGADPSGVFTSDLSVAEYVLLGEAGFEPLGFVVGSSIYHARNPLASGGETVTGLPRPPRSRIGSTCPSPTGTPYPSPASSFARTARS